MIDSGTLLQDRFLIEARIGMGGMGAVYRAVDQKFGSLVAIKETFYADEELAEAFEREARLLNGLQHPIFPHVSDCFTQNGGHFLVMQYIEGEDLAELLKRGEVFSVNTVLGWTLDILDGLDYLHSQNPPIIHRDIKPNNLKLTSRGKIVLLDFGMAKETSGGTIEAKSVFGYSRRYSPLEQIEGTGTDARADIFSLGATAYYLLTGQPPADALARASAIVAGRPDPLLPTNEVNPEIPESVAAILNSALVLSAENRLASARDMLTALHGAIDTIPNSTQGDRTFATAAGAGSMMESPVGAPAAAMQSSLSAASSNHTEGISLRTPPTTDSDEGAVTTPVLVSSGAERSSTAVIPNTSTPPMRIRRPARLRYAVAIPLLLLCLALVLFGTYRGLRSDEGTAEIATRPVPTENLGETSAPESANASAVPERPTIKGMEDSSRANSKKGAVVAAPDSTDQASDATTEEARVPTESREARSTDRRADNVRRADERPRRVRKPAFEQPSVSSIEAIMTGVPYEKSRESVDERDLLAEDELRRIRRRNRRNRQPY